MDQRMSQQSRKSFFRADYATIFGREDSWIIFLSREFRIGPFPHKCDIWEVRGGEDRIVRYSSPHAAAKAIERVRKDIPWSIQEKTEPKKETEKETDNIVSNNKNKKPINDEKETHGNNRLDNEPSQIPMRGANFEAWAKLVVWGVKKVCEDGKKGGTT